MPSDQRVGVTFFLKMEGATREECLQPIIECGGFRDVVTTVATPCWPAQHLRVGYNCMPILLPVPCRSRSQSAEAPIKLWN